jgi:heme/copper-type cytochrome/quinol oxidase subunit 4
MTDRHHSPDGSGTEGERRRPFWNTPAGFALCVFLAVAGVLIWIEHRAHILGALPLVLPLAICVGMHFFMHRGHGGGHGHGGGSDER